MTARRFPCLALVSCWLHLGAHFRLTAGWSLPSLTFFSEKRCHSKRISKSPFFIDSFSSSRLSSSLSVSSLSSLASSTATTSTTIKSWFPTRIQESVNYVEQVESLFLRHILVETSDMAQLALQQYLLAHANSTEPFGHVAQLISSCASTRMEGGRVGWVDLRQNNNNINNNFPHTATQSSSAAILPADVVESLIQLSPKPGDVHVLSSSITGQSHVLLVEEIMIRPQFRPKLAPSSQQRQPHQQSQSPQDNETFRVGMHKGQNLLLPRGKLPGVGTVSKVPELFSRSSADTNDVAKKTYLIQTAGCQMNVADSERLAGVLEHDLNLVDISSSSDPSSSSSSSPDVVIFNTCTIRDHAEQKVYDALGPYVKQKRQGKPLTLIVTGCVAQQEGEALLRRIPEVDVVMGPQYIPHVARVLEQVEWGHRVVATAPSLLSDYSSSTSSPLLSTPDEGLSSKPLRGHSVRAWVNVIAGCNEHCSYCVVPSVRGMEQSRSMQDIYQECYDLAQRGYKEITLLGQNIDAYGRDQVPKRTFAELLHYLNTHLPPGTIERIRYVTSHPRYFSDRVIDAVANLEKVCEFFHMPFQAGDNDVLKNMRRGYTYESYMRIIDRIRNKAPDAAICADVIVGFPGETDQAFERTLELMRQVKFDNLNSFSYSPRPNTEAATWESQIPEHVKSERLQRVQQLAAEHAMERSLRYVGRMEEVLVEDTNPRNPNQVVGRTRQGRQVYFDGAIDELQGRLVHVHITAARTWSLEGEMRRTT